MCYWLRIAGKHRVVMCQTRGWSALWAAFVWPLDGITCNVAACMWEASIMDGHSGSIREVVPIPGPALNVRMRNKIAKTILYTKLMIWEFQNCPFLVYGVMLLCRLLEKFRRYLLPRSLGSRVRYFPKNTGSIFVYDTGTAGPNYLASCLTLSATSWEPKFP